MADLESILQEGRALEERRHFEEAIAAYARARSLYPAAGDVHLALGRVYARERRYPEAVNAYFQAGALLLDADLPEEAHRAYSALIGLEKELAAGYSPPALQRIHSRKGDVAHGMARILYLRGSHAQALKLVSTALESEPTHVGMRTTLGLIHQDAGREAEAIEQFQAVVKMHRGNLDEARARERLAPLLAGRGAPPATVHDHYLRAAQFYQREGKLESAGRACQAALQLAPGHEATVALAAELRGLPGEDSICLPVLPGAAVIWPAPTTQGVRRVPRVTRDGNYVRLDFPATDDSPEGRAGSAWVAFYPELKTNQDVLRHMCELLKEPAEKLIPHVRTGKVPLGEVVRLSLGDARYDYAFVGPGVLFMRTMAFLPSLDWSAARLERADGPTL